MPVSAHLVYGVARNGNTSTFVYDSQTVTNRVSTTDVDGNTVTSSLDPRFGSALSTTDPSGNATSYHIWPDV